MARLPSDKERNMLSWGADYKHILDWAAQLPQGHTGEDHDGHVHELNNNISLQTVIRGELSESEMKDLLVPDTVDPTMYFVDDFWSSNAQTLNNEMKDVSKIYCIWG